jgi:alkyl sulfatase BDS1-like metallo-beta-lactamase superfamily hydrolase
VWLPRERVLFTGNMFGPIIGHLPNLYTIRGERIRSAAEFVRCVNLALDLEPELVVEGHAKGVTLDAATFRERATRVRDAVQWLHDEVIAGMNAGKDVWTLMREIRLPDDLAVAETHGKVAWCVRAIWEEYVGWFHYDSTTSLYDVRPTAVHPDLVELAGGVEPIAQRAQARFDAGELMESLYLAEIVLSVEPGHRQALELSRDIHEQLLEQTGRENFFETFWLQSCVTEAERGLA